MGQKKALKTLGKQKKIRTVSADFNLFRFLFLFRM